MKVKTLFKISVISFVFLVLSATNSTEIFGQRKCTKAGASQKFTIHNATSQPVQIKVVGSDCKEDGGKLLKAGDKAGGKSYEGVVFRVYDILSGEVISEITLEKTKELYTINEPNTEIPDEDKIDPAVGFLIATNAIRADNNLPAIELDERLTKACQWFAEVMAEVDRGYPVHKFSELGDKKLHKDRDKASQRLVYYGWDKDNKAHFEVVALDTVNNYNLIGDNFAKIWAFSTTHDKPFFDRDRVKYNRVGFGVAKAERGRNRYYACAIFGRIWVL
jgi:uncharacterized protein YkwD